MNLETTARSVATLFQDENVTFLAAGVAFYAFLSIIPLLVLTLAIGSLVGGEAFADSIVSLVEGQLSGQAATAIEDAVTGSTGRGGASIISLVALTWSALKVFRGIDLAFDEVYQGEAQASLPEQVLDALTVIVTVSLAIVLMLGLGTLLGRPALVDIPFITVIGWVVLILGLVVVLLPLYYVMPPVDVSLREILPGTLFASAGWLVLQAGFQLYAANAGQYQAYGFLGVILLFVTWLYFASALVLVGAVINAVLRGET
jgi:membrane protein